MPATAQHVHREHVSTCQRARQHVQAPAALIQDPALSALDVIIWIVLAARCIQGPQCWPRRETIAGSIGRHGSRLNTISEAVARLITAGWLETVVIFDQKYQKSMTYYRPLGIPVKGDGIKYVAVTPRVLEWVAAGAKVAHVRTLLALKVLTPTERRRKPREVAGLLGVSIDTLSRHSVSLRAAGMLPPGFRQKAENGLPQKAENARGQKAETRSTSSAGTTTTAELPRKTSLLTSRSDVPFSDARAGDGREQSSKRKPPKSSRSQRRRLRTIRRFLPDELRWGYTAGQWRNGINARINRSPLPLLAACLAAGMVDLDAEPRHVVAVEVAFTGMANRIRRLEACEGCGQDRGHHPDCGAGETFSAADLDRIQASYADAGRMTA